MTSVQITRPINDEHSTPTAPAPAPVEGRVTAHAGTFAGCQPKDAAHQDVQAALTRLAGIPLATMSDDYDPDDDAYATVRGATVAPCPSGAPGTVRIFWLIAGQSRSSGTSSETAAVDAERTSRLKEISRTFKAAGWTVRRSPRLVEATRLQKTAAPPVAPETGARLFKGPAVEQTAELAELLGMPTVRDLDDLSTLATLHSNLQAARGSKTASRQYRYAADHLRTARATLAETGKHEDPADRSAIADMAGAYVAAALFHAREADLTAV